jgi:type II secretory pathway predicted ATPase ExeA
VSGRSCYAHDLHSQTLLGLKRLIELVRRRGGRLSVVLAGHPKLRTTCVGQIGGRATVFELEGLQGHQRHYIAWVLEQTAKPKVSRGDLLTDEALELLAERLVPPLQVEHYLTLAFEQAYRSGKSR